MKETIIKWHSERKTDDKFVQKGVMHFTTDKSDIGGCVAYKTRVGTIAVLKDQRDRGYGFFTLYSLLERTQIKMIGSFKDNSPNGAINNAIKSGRHVYSFPNHKDLLKNHHIMIH